MRKKQTRDIFPSLAGQGIIGIDCECYDPDLKEKGPSTYRGGYIAGISVATEAGFAEYYPVAHECGENLPKEKVFSWLKKQLANSKQPKAGANLLYDMGFLREEGVEVKGELLDVLVAEPLLNENRLSYDLDHVAKDRIGRGKVEDEMIEKIVSRFGKKNPKANIWRMDPDDVRSYAIPDAQIPIDLFKAQKEELEKQELMPLFRMESALMPMLLDMRSRGVRIDVDRTQQMYDDLTKKQRLLEKKVKRKTGIEIDCWNPTSLAELFDFYGLEYPLTPKTKKPSFKADFLDNHSHPFTEDVRTIRQFDKLRGTFLESQLLGNQINGRIHCQFNQLKSDGRGTVSGRFSSSNPNLQFIPIRTEEGRMIRRLFLADVGQKWYKIDWSQIEYRLIAHDAFTLGLRGAAEVVERYQDPEADYHQILADMTGLSRSRAKTINFGLAYGEGVAKLCAQLGLSFNDGDDLIRSFHRKAPFMKPLLKHFKRQASVEGRVITMFGRRRRYDRWVTRISGKEVYTNHRINGSSDRMGVHAGLNSRVQGTAADIMKKAMVEIYESGVCDVIGVPQLTVHDELDGSYPDTKIGREAVAEMKYLMENTVSLSVPLIADLKTGPNWGDCE